MADLKYSRLLVKFSGESVAGEEGIGIDPKILDSMAVSIKLCKELGAEIGIVIGGGNLFRGERLSQSGMDRVNEAASLLQISDDETILNLQGLSYHID